MTPDEAREKLGFHSGRDPRIDDPRWKSGFLSSLRPYSGTLDKAAMRDVIACIRCLKDEIASDPLPADLINDLWGICHLGRAWAVDEGGMLRSNNLISDEDVATMDTWLSEVSFAILFLMDSGDDDQSATNHLKHAESCL